MNTDNHECKYCHEPFENLLDESEWALYVHKSNECHYYLIMNIDNQGYAITPIKYCPICGRKLWE